MNYYIFLQFFIFCPFSVDIGSVRTYTITNSKGAVRLSLIALFFYFYFYK